MAGRPVAEGLFIEQDGAIRLLAGRRFGDDAVVFPLPRGPEAACYAAFALQSQGILWSYTVQRFCPKAPFNGFGWDGGFAPYAVGYVELPGEIIVESRLVTDDFAALRIGLPMRLVPLVYGADAAGAPLTTYGFEPVPDGNTP